MEIHRTSALTHSVSTRSFLMQTDTSSADYTVASHAALNLARIEAKAVVSDLKNAMQAGPNLADETIRDRMLAALAQALSGAETNSKTALMIDGAYRSLLDTPFELAPNGYPDEAFLAALTEVVRTINTASSMAGGPTMKTSVH
jgi:hypothetical protein